MICGKGKPDIGTRLRKPYSCINYYLMPHRQNRIYFFHILLFITFAHGKYK